MPSFIPKSNQNYIEFNDCLMKNFKYDKNMIVLLSVILIMILVIYQKSKIQYQNHVILFLIYQKNANCKNTAASPKNLERLKFFFVLALVPRWRRVRLLYGLPPPGTILGILRCDVHSPHVLVESIEPSFLGPAA